MTVLARCIECKREMVWEPGDRAIYPGHVYSEAGRRETQMSGMCEWCWDHAFMDEPGPGV